MSEHDGTSGHSLMTCAEHGLKYDPAKSDGCVLCRRGAEQRSRTSSSGTSSNSSELRSHLVFLAVAAVVVIVVHLTKEKWGVDPLMFLGMGISLVSGIAIIVTAFKESVVWGLLIIVMPVVGWVFVFLRRGRRIKYLIANLVGVAFVVIGLSMYDGSTGTDAAPSSTEQEPQSSAP